MKTEFSETLRGEFQERQRAFNAGDFETAFANLPEDIEWHMGAWIPDAGDLRGRHAVTEFYRCLRDAGGWQVELVDIEDLGGGVLLLEQHGTWTGRSTGLTGERRFFQLWDIAHGVATRVREFETREQAVAAAG